MFFKKVLLTLLPCVQVAAQACHPGRVRDCLAQFETKIAACDSKDELCQCIAVLQHGATCYNGCPQDAQILFISTYANGLCQAYAQNSKNHLNTQATLELQVPGVVDEPTDKLTDSKNDTMLSMSSEAYTCECNDVPSPSINTSPPQKASSTASANDETQETWINQLAEEKQSELIDSVTEEQAHVPPIAEAISQITFSDATKINSTPGFQHNSDSSHVSTVGVTSRPSEPIFTIETVSVNERETELLFSPEMLATKQQSLEPQGNTISPPIVFTTINAIETVINIESAAQTPTHALAAGPFTATDKVTHTLTQETKSPVEMAKFLQTLASQASPIETVGTVVPASIETTVASVSHTVHHEPAPIYDAPIPEAIHSQTTSTPVALSTKIATGTYIAGTKLTSRRRHPAVTTNSTTLATATTTSASTKRVDPSKIQFILEQLKMLQSLDNKSNMGAAPTVSANLSMVALTNNRTHNSTGSRKNKNDKSGASRLDLNTWSINLLAFVLFLVVEIA